MGGQEESARLTPFSGSAKAFLSKMALTSQAQRTSQPWKESFRIPQQAVSSQRGPEDRRPPCPRESGTTFCCASRPQAAHRRQLCPPPADHKEQVGPFGSPPPNRKPKSKRDELNRVLLTAAPKVSPQPGWPGPDPPLVEAVVFPGSLGEGQLRKHVGHVVAVER